MCRENIHVSIAGCNWHDNLCVLFSLPLIMQLIVREEDKKQNKYEV